MNGWLYRERENEWLGLWKEWKGVAGSIKGVERSAYEYRGSGKEWLDVWREWEGPRGRNGEEAISINYT
jgi:hypothetical protein